MSYLAERIPVTLLSKYTETICSLFLYVCSGKQVYLYLQNTDPLGLLNPTLSNPFQTAVNAYE